MSARDSAWLDDDAGPVVRPYALTGGRTRAGGEGLDLVAFVLTVEPVPPPNLRLQPEHVQALELCRLIPLSTAEVASRLDLPVGVVRVLLGDLLEEQLIMVREPVYRTHIPDEYTLEAVLNGLKAL